MAPQVLHGHSTVDEMVQYKTGGIPYELIAKAAPKLGKCREKGVPRRFYSNNRNLMIQVRSEHPRTASDGSVIPPMNEVVRFRDGFFKTENEEHIRAVEGSYTYGLDTYDIDEFEQVVKKSNVDYVLNLLEKVPDAEKILRAKYAKDFLDGVDGDPRGAPESEAADADEGEEVLAELEQLEVEADEPEKREPVEQAKEPQEAAPKAPAAGAKKADPKPKAAKAATKRAKRSRS